MKTRIVCLGLVMALLLGGCGADHTPASDDHTTSTSTTTVTTTTDASTSVTDTTVASNTTDETNLPTTSGTSHPKTGSVTTTNRTPSATKSTGIPTSSATVANTITFKATVRDNVQRNPVSDVTVTVFVDGNPFSAGSAVTDENGVAQMALQKGNSYRVVLSTLPTGYEADAEYRFSSATVNITIRKAASHNETDHSEAQYDVGKTMTDFTLTDTDGKTYRLSDLLKEKKLVILNFWFTSCQPCKMEFPYFEAVANQCGDDIALLAIDPFDSVTSIVEIRRQLNVTFPMLQDTCNLYLGFDVTAYPTTVFLDTNGQILDIHVGSFPSETAFMAAVDRYLT